MTISITGRLRLLALLIGTAVAITACSGGTRPSFESSVDALPATTTTTTQPERINLEPVVTTEPQRDIPKSTLAAAVPVGVPEITIFEEPDGDEKLTMSNPNQNGAQRVFMVSRQDDDWVEVYLPVKPNGSTGWVRAEDVILQIVKHRLEVRLADHELILYYEGELEETYPIGVGRADRPTPGGVYYIQELLAPPDPNGPYGPYAYGLSAFTEIPALQNFAGGEGIIGIHGTSDPGSIGTDASSGCIRLHNEDIIAIEGAGLPLGTPVDIFA